MVSGNLMSDLLRLDAITCRHLWKMQFETDRPVDDAPKLIIPLNYDSHAVSSCQTGTRRVSEQEARFAFVHALDSHRVRAGVEYYYSVETPTYALHSFTGNKSISGNIDLSIYRSVEKRYKQICNVEFKANQPESEHIGHDFLKLILDERGHDDQPIGHYFHLIDAANAGTIPALFCKFKEAFAHAGKKLTQVSTLAPNGIQFNIAIVICILNATNERGKWGCFKDFSYSGSIDLMASNMALFFEEQALRECNSLEAQRRCLRRNKWQIIT